ncbi:hypothetical protein DKX38_023427 [Salix brachista]|uniref:Uncharacterized protein n=1 Tax=Salix brachista TaxID=2182728 RepID=A0A5N5JIW6_9ROSI|nr:hypothetical protein DKX38_023427 [Salix brachista]
MPNVLYGMLKMGSEYVNELFVVSLTIFMFAGLGCVDITRKCLDLAHAFAIKNLAVLNAVIVMYSRQGFEIDFVTDTAVLPAASNLRNQEIGKQSHAYLLRHEIHFEGINGFAIDMYAKCGLIRIAP